MEGKAQADRRSAPIRRRGWTSAPLVVTLCVLFVSACSSTTKTTATTTTDASSVTTEAGAGGALTTTAGGATSSVTTAPAPTTTKPSTSSSSTSSTSTSSTSTTTTLPPTTTTTLPLITQGGVVIVANASGIDGAAAAVSSTLSGLGFQTVKATNAAGYEDSLDVSKVYFAPEAYGPAYSIAQLMGGVAVAPMPTPPPILLALEGLRGANVIVMLGKDLAGHPLPGVP